MPSMKRLREFAVISNLVLILLWIALPVRAQGSLSAQVLRLLDRVNTWSAAQTFGDVTISGTCTGCSGGSGAPTDAQYWTGAANATLSAEKNLGALSTGLVINTTGVPTAYTGSTCTSGQFTSAISASGVATCGTPAGNGTFVKQVTVQSGAVASGATTIPVDDTKPQITEGTEFLTLAITPTSGADDLNVDADIFITVAGTTVWGICALFQDAGVDALATGASFVNTSTSGFTVPLHYKMSAGTTSATTFRVRCGSNAGATVTFNGQSAARLFGGITLSSITITETVP
jgi:hypothetical protein